MQEIFERYDVNENGVVTNIRTGNIVKSHLNKKKGYLQLNLYIGKDKCTISIHRLVAYKYVPNPDNKQVVNHIDAIKTNNHYTNLEWCTQMENIQHAENTGLMSGNPSKQVNKLDINTGEFICTYSSISKASKDTGTNANCIGMCCNGKIKSSGGFKWVYKE